MKTFLTIPTAGSRPALLDSLIKDSGLPKEQVIVVATRPDIELPEGVIRIECFEVLNIQHWWNLGISEALGRGATFVAVSNDDVRVSPSTIPDLVRELEMTGATLASPGSERLHVRRYLPFGRMLDGSFWVLDVRTDLRPDEDFVWWFGDDDLDLRARRDYGGTVSLPVEFHHIHANEATSQSAVLVAQARVDALTFRRKFRLVKLLSPPFRVYRKVSDGLYRLVIAKRAP